MHDWDKPPAAVSSGARHYGPPGPRVRQKTAPLSPTTGDCPKFAMPWSKLGLSPSPNGSAQTWFSGWATAPDRPGRCGGGTGQSKIPPPGQPLGHQCTAIHRRSAYEHLSGHRRRHVGNQNAGHRRARKNPRPGHRRLSDLSPQTPLERARSRRLVAGRRQNRPRRRPPGQAQTGRRQVDRPVGPDARLGLSR